VSKESRRASRNARASTRTSSGPSGSTRAGRRERVRHYEQPKPSLERYRSAIIGVVVVAVAAVVAGLVFVQSTQASYSCSIEFSPSPTPSPEPGASTRIGFAQDSMGNSHEVSRPQRYTFCPPASGNHYNAAGIGPIAPRVFGPDDAVGPPNWIHNLEHGGLVVLYRNDSPGATAAGLQAFQEFYNTFPASPICKVQPYQISPVIARFDTMPHPYAVLVWGRVFYMDTWDPALAIRFFNEEDERLDADGALIQPPEDFFGCAAKLQSASPAPSDSGSPAASGAASAAPSASPAPSPSAS
jgi:Protein of unknown function (DUF3105)